MLYNEAWIYSPEIHLSKMLDVTDKNSENLENRSSCDGTSHPDLCFSVETPWSFGDDGKQPMRLAGGFSNIPVAATDLRDDETISAGKIGDDMKLELAFRRQAVARRRSISRPFDEEKQKWARNARKPQADELPAQRCPQDGDDDGQRSVSDRGPN